MRSIAERLAYQRRNKKSLNPKLFDDLELKSEVRDKILDIVDAFLDYAEVDAKILDVRFVGSNANYNYNDYSDLDIHIVTDLSKIADPEAIARLYFDSVKRNFRDSYDITIKGIPVEIYVEDIKGGATSSAVYSVTKDEWIREPEEVPDPTSEEYAEAEEIEEEIISQIKDASSVDEIEDILDDLYLMRRDALTAHGETAPANLAFKSLRNKGVIDQMKDIVRGEEAKKLSLEGMRKRKRGTM